MEGNNSHSTNSNQMPFMDDGELEFSNHIGDIPSSGSMDSFFEELLMDTHACTHAHTCNPPGPDLAHTHTCFHVHTKIVPPPGEEKSGNDDDTSESEEKNSTRGKRVKKGSNNKEAVRKYRFKKKAENQMLEEEVRKLRAANQMLLKRLQGQAQLEAEVARLKCLLVDIRGRIEGEIGSFPYQRPVKSGDMYQSIGNASIPGSYMLNPCNVQCGEQIYCLHPGVDGKSAEDAILNGQGIGSCEFENLNCMTSMGSAPKDLFSCGATNVTANVAPPTKSKRKANNAATAS